MKIAPRDIEQFLRAPPPGIRAVLLYGPDGGLVRERARALVTAVAGDPGDPFRVAELNSAEIKSDPARLGDEAAAMSFTGGRRAVRVRDADDGVAPAVAALLSAAPGGSPTDSLIVVEAGDLPARAALRKAFENASGGAALPCYRDDERALPAVIGESLRAAGLSAAPDALAFLAANLGGDRMITRRELEKLALYMGADPDGGQSAAQGARRRVELDDARACVGDSADLTLEDLVFALGGGELSAMERSLDRALREGANPVAILRAAARHLQRLHLVAGAIAGGAAPDAAMKTLRPAPFWKRVSKFKAQAQAWAPARLGAALARLLEAERACKRSGAPAELLCAEAMGAIARCAPGASRSRRESRAVSAS